MINGKIADTSAWIDYFNNCEDRNSNAIVEAILADKIMLLPVIVQESLQGVRNEKEFSLIKSAFLQFPFLDYDTKETAFEAASLYRFLQKKGSTIRKPNDCLIASICIIYNFQLIHNDKDFTQIAKHTNLKIYNTNT